MRSSSAAARSKRLMRDDRVVKRMDLAANDLAGFMALAGNDKHITSPETGNGSADRGAALADFDGARCGGEDRAANRRRIFAARIVIGDVNTVGESGCHLTHQRPFAAVPIATSAEHDDKAGRSMWPQC